MPTDPPPLTSEPTRLRTPCLLRLARGAQFRDGDPARHFSPTAPVRDEPAHETPRSGRGWNGGVQGRDSRRYASLHHAILGWRGTGFVLGVAVQRFSPPSATDTR